MCCSQVQRAVARVAVALGHGMHAGPHSPRGAACRMCSQRRASGTRNQQVRCHVSNASCDALAARGLAVGMAKLATGGCRASGAQGYGGRSRRRLRGNGTCQAEASPRRPARLRVRVQAGGRPTLADHQIPRAHTALLTKRKRRSRFQPRLNNVPDLNVKGNDEACPAGLRVDVSGGLQDKMRRLGSAGELQRPLRIAFFRSARRAQLLCPSCATDQRTSPKNGSRAVFTTLWSDNGFHLAMLLRMLPAHPALWQNHDGVPARISRTRHVEGLQK